MAQINWPRLEEVLANPSQYGEFFQRLYLNFKAYPSEASANYQAAIAEADRQISRGEQEVYNAMNNGTIGDPKTTNGSMARHYWKDAQRIVSSLGEKVSPPLPSIEQISGQPMKDPQGKQVVDAKGNVQIPPPIQTTQSPVAPQATNGTNTNGIDQAGWTDSMKQAYDAMNKYVQNITSRGQIVNPDIKIDDATIQRFTTQAKTELAPYYGQLFNQAEQDLKTAAEQITNRYQKNVRDIGWQYGQQLQNTQENLAKRGLGQGQYREQQEARIRTKAEQAMQDAAVAATAAAKETGTAGERQLGSAKIGSFTPTIATGQTIASGPGQYGLTNTTNTRLLFSPVGSTTGTLEANQLNAEQQRIQDLTTNERSLRSLNYL